MSTFADFLPGELDAVLRSLSDGDSRLVCRYFRQRSTDVADLRALAEFVAERADPGPGTDRVEIRLHHVTLPMLADAGYIDYTPGERVRYHGSPLVDAVLDHIAREGPK